jgi:ornithine cyclodeaminase/alanine dehydrogenase-like protein (mu-crystallin family)
MLILSRHVVEALLTMPDTIEALEEGFRRLARGEVTMPQRVMTSVAPHQGIHLSMPAFVAGDPGVLTVKIVTVYPENQGRYQLPTIHGNLLLHDARSGQPLALMDAEHLTAMRTGAASGVATRHLARTDASTVTLFGAGVQAGPQLAAVCAVRPITRAWVITQSGEKDASFCARVSHQLGIDVRPTRDIEQAVRQADVICTATNAGAPLFDGAWLRPGVHLNLVGTFTANRREVDTTTVQRSRLFVDHHPAAQVEAGDLLIPIANQELRYEQVAGSLGELLTGQVVGRSDDQEITLFKSVGLAMQDAMTAAHVYRLARERNLGQWVDL